MDEQVVEMTLKQAAEELVTAAMACTSGYVDGIQALQLAILLMKDEFKQIEKAAGQITDLLVEGRLEEARTLSANFGIDLVWRQPGELDRSVFVQ